jgi:hypothetical protein
MTFKFPKFWAAKPKLEHTLEPKLEPPQEAPIQSIGETPVNTFEKIFFAFLLTAAKDAPIFVHSNQGMLILNAGEDFVGNLLAAFQKPAAAPAPATPAA